MDIRDYHNAKRPGNYLKKIIAPDCTGQNLLLEMCHFSMEKQKDELARRLEDWKGNHSQTDDILVIGISA